MLNLSLSLPLSVTSSSLSIHTILLIFSMATFIKQAQKPVTDRMRRLMFRKIKLTAMNCRCANQSWIVVWFLFQVKSKNWYLDVWMFSSADRKSLVALDIICYTWKSTTLLLVCQVFDICQYILKYILQYTSINIKKLNREMVEKYFRIPRSYEYNIKKNFN